MPKHRGLLFNGRPASRSEGPLVDPKALKRTSLVLGGLGSTHAMDADALAALLFVGFEHDSNKIHHWGIPARPMACSVCTSAADSLRQDLQVRRQFLHMVLLSMFTAAGGYSKHHRYFDEFENKWSGCCPDQVLTAARASIYSSGLHEVQDWCTECHPALAHYLWTPPTIGKLCCCAAALDTLD